MSEGVVREWVNFLRKAEKMSTIKKEITISPWSQINLFGKSMEGIGRNLFLTI